MITTDLGLDRRQVAAGHPPTSSSSEKVSGWEGPTALDALKTRCATSAASSRRDDEEDARGPCRGAHPCRRAVVDGGDRSVRVLMALSLPRVVVLAT